MCLCITDVELCGKKPKKSRHKHHRHKRLKNLESENEKKSAKTSQEYVSQVDIRLCFDAAGIRRVWYGILGFNIPLDAV